MSQRNEWIVCPKVRATARLRLFCFSYAGVGASAFRGWADQLDSSIEVCSVQLPGRESRLRECPFKSLEELLPPLVEGLSQLLDRPYAFYGHSLGARIAFETARELRRSRGSQPIHLFAGACPAPHLPWQYSLMHTLEEDEFLAEIQRRYGGIPQQVIEDAEIRSLLVPGMRADVTMLETYRYRPETQLACGITAFGGVRDPIVTLSSLDEWQRQTLGRFRVECFEGDHFFIQSARRQLLASIAFELKQVRAPDVLRAGTLTGVPH